jgi:hypothetical protein
MNYLNSNLFTFIPHPLACQTVMVNLVIKNRIANQLPKCI